MSFVNPYIKPKPTESPDKKYIDAAIDASKDHKEDINIAALGVQRVKEFLQDIATQIEASGELDGPRGPDGIILPNNPVVAVHANLTTTSQDPLVPLTLDYTLSAGELDETKSIILISCYQYGLSDIYVWIDGGFPGAPIKVFQFGLSPLFPWGPLLTNDGHVDIWLSPLIGWFDVVIGGGYPRVTANAMGVASNASNTFVVNHWMSMGGVTIRVGLWSKNTLPKWGGDVTIFKVTSPTFVLE